MDDLHILLAFSLSKKFSTRKVQQLLKSSTSLEQAFALCFPSSQELLPLIEKELETADTLGARLIPYTSPEFPEKLKSLPDCPLILYVKGTLPPKEQLVIAIIGTRQASEWGKESAWRFAEHLAREDVCIVSGLARGIDTAAHRGSLQTGTTVAFIGSGFAHLYPKENEQLAEKIASSGAVVTEFSCSTPPAKSTFPKRNRLISAFSDALVLAEAPLKSGAMLTMEIGYLQKKPLFSLPGRALQSSFAGNHALIKSGKAILTQSPEEILSFFNRNASKKNLIPNPTSTSFDKEEKKVLDFLSQSEVSLDALSCATGLSISRLQATLVQLQLKNFVVELPGKRYMLK